MDTICYLCKGNNLSLRHKGVRDNADIDVLECHDCGLIFLSTFSHINDNFYEQSSMLGGKVDLKKYRINSLNDDNRRYHTLKDSLLNKRLLDFGCGGGGFLKLAEQVAESVRGVELDRTIRQTLNEKDGIEVFRSVDDLSGEYDVVTLFHVLEHLPDPVAVLKHLKSHLSAKGKLIIEVPNGNDALLQLYRCSSFERFTYWSCHLILFIPETLKKVAELAGYHVQYIKQVQRYPLSNHLHWLAMNKPGGHQVWDFMNTPDLHAAYEKQLASIGMCDTLFACLYRQ
mgnify:FL=1